MGCRRFSLGVFLLVLILPAGCSNNPYPPEDRLKSTLYIANPEDPKGLDPTYAYYDYENFIVDVIYLSFYQYQHLKRDPLVLELALGAEEPRCEPYPYLEMVDGQTVLQTGEIWTFRFRRGVRFQDDPCFPGGRGREVTAADVLYAFKRMADPKLNCPIVSYVEDKILGYEAFFQRNRERSNQQLPMDYSTDVAGLQVDPGDPYILRITLNQPYPQLRYLMAMHFTTPIAHEAVERYGYDGYPRHPVGCGPFVMTEWSPKQRMVLERNPNFFGQTYPSEGAPGDQEAGLLEDAGKPLPLADAVVIEMIRENVTGWNFFLQGYLDRWTVQAENFQQAITPGRDLTPEMRRRGIRMALGAEPNVWYLGFNMKDPVVGGYTPEKQKLRQAISLSINSEEILDLTLGGFGTPAEFLIPPAVSGYDPAYRNPYRTNDLARAKELLAEAGYPDGISRETGQRLTLVWDNYALEASLRQRLGLMLRQVERIGIRVESRTATIDVWREKVDDGRFQIMDAGWQADYPDPENFVFLLYGPNRRPGPNACDYENPEYDRLFEEMRAMSDGPERQALIDRMRKISVEDCPWVFMYHDQLVRLVYPWLHNLKPHPVSADWLKYARVDAPLRARLRLAWNRPNYGPLGLLALFLVVGTTPAVAAARRRRAARGRKLA
jgi:oligopeptide transport system substrate-binding protein